MDVAVLSARALGDGILALVLARNLRAAGHGVTLHHDALVELAPWLPDVRLAPLPRGPARAELLATAPALFLGDPDFEEGPAPTGQARVVFRKSLWERTQPYLRSLERACAAPFGLDTWSDDAGLLAPPMPQAPRATHRIALHPTSARPAKNWPPDRWVQLGARLRAEGWAPEVLLATDEVEAWRRKAGDVLPVAVPGRLDAVAAWLQGARACVATDSGIAHLASAVGTPTLTIFRKRSAARFWAPHWGRTAVVAAPWRLPGGRGHRLWGRLLSARRVQSALDALLQQA